MNKEKWEREKKTSEMANKQTNRCESFCLENKITQKRATPQKKSKSPQLVRFGLVGGIVLVVLVIHWILSGRFVLLPWLLLCMLVNMYVLSILRYIFQELTTGVCTWIFFGIWPQIQWGLDFVALQTHTRNTHYSLAYFNYCHILFK